MVKIIVHVMSFQLLWPTTAKTENPRKEPGSSLWLLFNDVTAQRVTLSNNDPWAIWEICSYDSLLIDLKISNYMCRPFRIGVHMDFKPSLEWSTLCLDSLTWMAIRVQGCKHTIPCLRGPCTQSLHNKSYVGNLKGLYFNCADRLSKLKLVAMLIG